MSESLTAEQAIEKVREWVTGEVPPGDSDDYGDGHHDGYHQAQVEVMYLVGKVPGLERPVDAPTRPAPRLDRERAREVLLTWINEAIRVHVQAEIEESLDALESCIIPGEEAQP